jgi:6-phosphofructokinase
MVFLLA